MLFRSQSRGSLQKYFIPPRPLPPGSALKIPSPTSWRTKELQNISEFWQGKSRARRRILRIASSVRGVAPDSFIRSVSLSTKQVIYAIYSTRFNKIYVSMTYNSAFHRYKQHICAGCRIQQRGKNVSSQTLYPLAIAIAKTGWEHWRVFPLEHISGVFTSFKFFMKSHVLARIGGCYGFILSYRMVFQSNS